MTPNPALAVSSTTAVSAPRLLARSAAWLLLLSLLTGGYVAAAMTGKIPVDGRTALSAHLGAMFGALILVAVAWSLPMTRYGEVGQKRLAWGFIVPLFANWFLTAVKAAFHVSAIDVTHVPANDTIFALLNVLVVLPSLAAAAAWVYGLHGEPRA